MTYAYDAAYSPNLAKVKAAGGIAINGYLTGTYALSTTQPAAARAAGLGYVPTYEQGAAELVGASRATGQAVGRRILAAFVAKGLPLDGTVAVYPSVDVSVPIDGTDRDADACNDAWRGMRDILVGKVSIRAYAEGAVIDALAAAGLVDGKCWLAAPTSWPGYSVTDSNVCMIQLVGTDVAGTDRNHIITDPHALGAWWPDGSIYAQEADPMAGYTLDEIADAVWSRRLHYDPTDKTKTMQAGTLLSSARAQAVAGHAAATSLMQLVGTAKTGVLARVASLQSAVAALAPDAVDTVDVGAVVDGVVARLKAMTWRVGA